MRKISIYGLALCAGLVGAAGIADASFLYRKPVRGLQGEVTLEWILPVHFGTTTIGAAMAPVVLPAAVSSQGRTISYVVQGDLPPGLTFDAATRTISGTPTMMGGASMVIMATDGLETVSRTFTMMVAAGQPPTWNPSTALGVVPQGLAIKPITLVAATDPEGQAVTYSLVSGMPPGLSFDADNRRISGTPTAEGSYPSIVIRASDGESNVDLTFSMTVTKELSNSCAALKAIDSSVADGVYQISVAGTPMSVYCDMANGGWTLIASTNGNACKNGGFPQVGSLTNPNGCGYLPGATVRALAAVSTSVRLEAKSSPSYKTAMVTSTNANAIQALRSSSGNWHNGAAWTGDWSWVVGYCAPTQIGGWPNMFHACGNGGGVHWIVSEGHMNHANLSNQHIMSRTWVR